MNTTDEIIKKQVQRAVRRNQALYSLSPALHRLVTVRRYKKAEKALQAAWGVK